MTQITWKGDFANEPKSGVVESEVNGLLRIVWSDGTKLVVPSDVVSERNGWARS